MKLAFDIETDGRTVWVNGPAGAVGRFGERAIDVHNATNTACVNCAHPPMGVLTTSSDWDEFVRGMKAVHGVEVPAKYKPKRLRSVP